jgi:4-hydroxy-tetrahydrodipicolinate synthase
MRPDLGTILTAMVTPFDEELAVDYAGAERLAAWLLDNGSDGLVVGGTTGESPTLTDDEKLELFRVVIAAVGDRAPVVAGTGTYDTRHSIELTRAAERCGADAALVVTPYYNKPPERGLIEHFRAVAAATDLPVVIYNIPGRSGVNLSSSAIATLADVENIVGVKQANADLDELDRLSAIEGFGLYAGDNELLIEVLRRGGRGGVLVASHVVGPRMAEVARLCRAGDEAGAVALDDQLKPLYKALAVTTNPIPVKAALNMLGHDVGGLRLPLVEADTDERAVVAGALRDLGVLSR